MLKFDGKIQDDKVEREIKRILINDNILKKYFFLFKSDCLCVAKDTSGKTLARTILYRDIYCLNMLSNSSFYFKGNKHGYCIFLQQYHPKNAIKWYKYLLTLLEKLNENLNKIKKISFSSKLPQLYWNQTNRAFFNDFREIREELLEREKNEKSS